jgi:hypothetical protein
MSASSGNPHIQLLRTEILVLSGLKDRWLSLMLKRGARMTHGTDPSTWAPELGAVKAAPKHHKVLFENDGSACSRSRWSPTMRSRSIIIADRLFSSWT